MTLGLRQDQPGRQVGADGEGPAAWWAGIPAGVLLVFWVCPGVTMAIVTGIVTYGVSWLWPWAVWLIAGCMPDWCLTVWLGGRIMTT